MSPGTDNYDRGTGGTGVRQESGTSGVTTTVSPEQRTNLRSTRAVLGLGLLMLVIFGLLLLAGYIPHFRRNETLAKAAEDRTTEAPVVTVTPATRAKAEAQLTLPGSATALIEAPIYGRASGYISERFVDIGDRVKAGQLLATIDAPDLDQQVDQARASLRQSESVSRQTQAQVKLASVTWDRYKALVAEGVVSRQDADVQEANYNVSLANVQAAQDTVSANTANLARLLRLQGYERVTAPFAGVVTARNIDVGSLISTSGGGLGASNTASAALPSTGTATQGGEMFRVARLDRLRVFVTVPESSARFVTTGQTVSLRFDSVPGKVFEGRVVRTTNAVDPNTRTLLTEIQAENKDGVLLPGTYVTVTFNHIRAVPPLVVSGDTLITRSTGTLVATVRNNVVHLQPVVLGRDYGAQVEIREGLQEGDRVIVNPGDSAKEGAKVNARLLPQNTQSSQTAGQMRNGANTGDQTK